jgi:DNA-binding XRE family transcriptional regulator
MVINGTMPETGGRMSPVAQRLRQLRAAMEYDTQEGFARFLGIDGKRYHNYENGYNLPNKVALLMCQRIHGLSTSWLYQGAEGDLTVSLRDKLKNATPATRRRRHVARGGDGDKEA